MVLTPIFFKNTANYSDIYHKNISKNYMFNNNYYFEKNVSFMQWKRLTQNII